MKTVTRIFLAMTFLVSSYSFGQQKALEYMNQFSEDYSIIQQDMWDYTRSVSHGHSARKVEKRRMELIGSAESALKKAEKVGDFEGDTDFRDAVIEYFNLVVLVLKEDYEKIVDMEEIAEQSYDLMEAYINARKAASEKQTLAAETLHRAQKMFAKDNNITLIESTDEIDQKMLVAEEVYNHYNEVFLIFFKSNKQEMYLLEAIGAGDISAIEQNREALKSAVTEGYQNLESVSKYEDDASMIEATKAVFKFFEKEVKDAKLAVDFYLNKEKFDKIKEAFDNKKEKDRTQEDVDEYNNAVNELNAAAEAYNKMNEENNKQRESLINDWNSIGEKFTNKHVPRGK